MSTLLAFRHRRKVKAENGGSGKGAKKHGGNGKDVEFTVPVGTEIWWVNGEERKVGDLTAAGEAIVVAMGGKGGRGNARFATSINRFPLLAEGGEPGEEITLRLELKLLADVGIIGAPNAGKSSLLAALTAARPKIASYPFTTTEPMLGVVERNNRAFVMVDIPGLIEGAHSGVGLGHDFLRHIERTRVVVHVVDGSGEDPIGEYRRVRNEMALFNEDLVQKPEIVVLNKTDVEGVPELATEIGRELGGSVEGFCCISAAARTGLDALEEEVARMLNREPGTRERPAPVIPVLRPATVDEPELVRRVGDRFEVTLSAARRIAATVDERSWEARVQLYDQLRRLGVTAALEQAGIRSGQTFRVGKLKWKWE